MPLSLKTTVTRRQPAPVETDSPNMAADDLDTESLETGHQTANADATDTADTAPASKAKVGAHALPTAVLNASIGKPVTIFLINGIRLAGKLRQFDMFTLLLEAPDGVQSLVFKHAISTIQPPARRPDFKDK